MITNTRKKKLPLEGVRVLGFTQSWTGPFAGMLLGDLGAEHLRLEQIQYAGGMTRGLTSFPLRDMWINKKFGRTMQYPDHEPTGPNGEYHMNRFSFGNCHLQNTYGFTLDFTRPIGMDLLKRIIAISDIFLENNTPSTAPKLGLTPEYLHEINPKMIIIRAPGYGLSGPYTNWKGFGANIESSIGHVFALRYSDNPEHAVSNLETYSMDNCGAHSLAAAAMMGLLQREKSGKGMLIEIAQAEGVMGVLPIFWMDYFANGRTQPAYANRHPTAIQGCYPTKGEKEGYDWVVITIHNDEEWNNFCQALEYPHWSKKQKFVDCVSRHNNQDELDEHISSWSRQHNNYAIMHLLQKHGVPAGPVLTEEMVFRDEHLLEHDFFIEETQKWCGTHKYSGYTGQFKKTPRRNRADMPATGIGEYNEYVFKGLLGLSNEDYLALEKEHYIGTEMLPDAKSSI
ncbi:CoA transferase [bacterium]|nr:CoA transferase [bacterium]